MLLSIIATIAGYMSLISAFFMFLLIIPIIKRYLDRKKINTLYLVFSIFSWLIATVSAGIIYFFADTHLNLSIWAQKIVYSGVFLGCMFLFQFSQGIFLFNQKKIIHLYWVIGTIIILLTLLLNSVEIGQFPDDSNHPLLTIKLLYSILVVIFLIPTIISIFVKALQTASKVDDMAYKFGFRVIAIGQIMVILTFLIDTIASLVVNNPNLYSWMLYLTWIFPLLACIFYYLGWIMPRWLKELFNLPKN